MPKATILVGDVFQRLSEVSDNSVRTAITSPPYWGLRDYGVDGQLGSEPTPQEYIDNLVSVMREVRRTLTDDGTLWLNLGDSYFNAQNSNRNGSSGSLGGVIRGGGEYKTQKRSAGDLPIKHKDLVGIPWRVAFALQADGWYLRQDIIWAKPNPMPESATDRCTKSHEYIFLFSKTPKYHFNHEAIREEATTKKRNPRQFGATKQEGTLRNDEGRIFVDTGLRNKRDVWFVPTRAYKGAHFAVFPEALIEPCVLATSEQDDLVLDPFTGSGTTAVVALRHGRRFIGTELNSGYADIAYNRIATDAPLENEVELR